jgi:hypothetical protein
VLKKNSKNLYQNYGAQEDKIPILQPNKKQNTGEVQIRGDEVVICDVTLLQQQYILSDKNQLHTYSIMTDSAQDVNSIAAPQCSLHTPLFVTVNRNERIQILICCFDSMYGDNTTFLTPFEFLYIYEHINIYYRPIN